ncbi:MAG TPA: mandelate racemase/muconate lactonizing enzyme family protein [Urbifossiella sp.]|nr:mandelate racemase/muconate lactonizing enzyme family protein [Urbifossiella sp.]
MRITRIATDHLRVPITFGNRISLSGPKPSPETIDVIVVDLATDAGNGLGFTYLQGPGAAAARDLIDNEMSSLMLGEEAADIERLFAKAESRFRPVGFGGLAARAYAAIDIALWDLKAKAAGLPLYQFLGHNKPAAPFFASDIAILNRPAVDAVKLAQPLVKQGAMGVRVEVGSGDVRADADRVREISDGLGDAASVSVAADGRFDLGTAEALTHFFEDIGIDWFEDPIPTADELGYAKLASLAEIPLAIGASFDSRERFFRVLRSGTVRTVRPDPCRLGGITPLLKIAAVAEAFQAAVSPVRMPEVGVHLACGLAAVPHVDRVSWFAELFTGAPTIENGKLTPSRLPGLGIALDEIAASKRRVAQ